MREAGGQPEWCSIPTSQVPEHFRWESGQGAFVRQGEQCSGVGSI